MLCPVAGQQNQKLATPDTDGNNASRKAKPVLKKVLKTLKVRNREEFEESIAKIEMTSMKAGGQTIDLSRLARKTVAVALNTDAKQMEKYQKQLKAHKKAEEDHRKEHEPSLDMQAGKDVDQQLESEMNRWRQGHQKPEPPKETVTEDEGWQIMFNLIAYIFHPAQDQVPDIARALSSLSPELRAEAACSVLDLPIKRVSKNMQDLDKEHASQEADTSGSPVSDTVDVGELNKEDLQITKYKGELKRVANGFREWIKADVHTPLTKVYVNYNKLQTVQLYDKMLELSKKEEHQCVFKQILESEDIETGTRRGIGHATPVLKYISRQICPAPGEGRGATTKIISNRITQFRPVVEVHKVFGDGIICFLGTNTRDLVNRVSPGEEEAWKPSEKLMFIAGCLMEADRRFFCGGLADMLSDVEELILQPALEPGETNRPKNCPSKEALKRLDIGARLDYLLTQMKSGAGADADADADADSAETREEIRKRGRRSGKADQGAGRAKRRRHVLDSADFLSKDNCGSPSAGANAETTSPGEERCTSKRLHPRRGKADDGVGRAERSGHNRDSQVPQLV